MEDGKRTQAGGTNPLATVVGVASLVTSFGSTCKGSTGGGPGCVGGGESFPSVVIRKSRFWMKGSSVAGCCEKWCSEPESARQSAIMFPRTNECPGVQWITMVYFLLNSLSISFAALVAVKSRGF